MYQILRFIFYPLIILRRKYRANLKVQCREFAKYDIQRFMNYAGCFHWDDRLESLLTQIIMAYHVVEKGLTMPNRRYGFGHDAIINLLNLIEKYRRCYYNEKNPQVDHAIGVVRAYVAMHREVNFDMSKDHLLWDKLIKFDVENATVPIAFQLHFSAAEFFAKNDAPFPAFAMSRHTLRHYEGIVSIDKIKAAVELAMTAPSACNRQHVRVYCVSNHKIRDKLFLLQNGNRGFGHLADKLLVVVGDLEDIRWKEERNDLWVNVGIFIMNLCYSLHYNKIAHCILNWSCSPDSDILARKVLPVKPNETIVALIPCGNAPTEFDVAVSPRKRMDDIFKEIR